MVAKPKGFAEQGSFLGPIGPPDSVAGHRDRIRLKLLQSGPDSLADYELMEVVLFLAILRRDTKPIAKRLISHFGSFANAIAAPVGALSAVEGVGESCAAM